MKEILAWAILIIAYFVIVIPISGVPLDDSSYLESAKAGLAVHTLIILFAAMIGGVYCGNNWCYVGIYFYNQQIKEIDVKTTEIKRVCISGLHPRTKTLLASVTLPWDSTKAAYGFYSRKEVLYIRKACEIVGLLGIRRPVIKVDFYKY